MRNLRKMRTVLVLMAVFPATFLPRSASLFAASPGNAGHVFYQRLAAPELDPFTNSPGSTQQAWFRTHFFRMGVFSPYFDSRTSWYPDGLVCVNLYGVDPDSPILKEHPDWILHDERGRFLFIPFACKGGTCARYAGDIANVEFRSWWIRQMDSVLSRFHYRGLWIDDVNMEFRVSDGYGKQTAPVDLATGQLMTWDAWRDYVAGFTVQIRRSFPKAEIVQNPVWFAGPQPARDADPAIRRQLRTADNINLERGLASDRNLTGGTGPWSIHALFDFVDRVHAAGPGVTLEEYSLDLKGKQYALAGYFLISNGNDRFGDADTHPDNWWSGYDVDLGTPRGPRIYKNGVYSRVFFRGMVLLGEPGLQPQTIPLNATFTTLDGNSVNSIQLSARQGVILLGSVKK